MLLAPIIWVLTVLICYFFIAKTWWFPPPISAHGLAYDAQFMRTLIVVGIIFFLAQFALGWVIVKFRNDGGRASTPTATTNSKLIWTSATAILFLGLVVMGTKIWANVHFDEAPPDSVQIEVMAKQFAFNFRYPGADGKFGHTELRLINDANGDPFGMDPKDPAGKDDIISARSRFRWANPSS
jgi:cytochrome c oxidase subunit II